MIKYAKNYQDGLRTQILASHTVVENPVQMWKRSSTKCRKSALQTEKCVIQYN